MGNKGNDSLSGDVGNDQLFGGQDNDTLLGGDGFSNSTAVIDSLVGGLGSDVFVFGDSDRAYYTVDGDGDYALVADFNANTDTIQLHGSSGDYNLVGILGNTGILKVGTGADELIGIVEGVTSLDLTDPYFTYV